MRIKLQEYLDQFGKSPFEAWFKKLPAAYAAKVATRLDRLALGNTSGIKWFAGLGELRIDWGPGLRVYLAKDGDVLLILFGGGTKSTQETDVFRAKALLAEYKARKRLNKKER